MCRQLVQFVIMHMQSYVLLEFLDFAIITFKIKGALLFFPKLVYSLRTTTTRHMVSFIDFYFHFLANFHT